MPNNSYWRSLTERHWDQTMVNLGHRPSIRISPGRNPTIVSAQHPRYSRAITGDKYAERPTTVRYEIMPRVPRNPDLQPG